MDDLIPLIIVILISIAGALTRKKKPVPGNRTRVPDQKVHSGDDLFSWLEKLSVDDKEEEVLPKQVAVPVSKNPVPNPKVTLPSDQVGSNPANEIVPNVYSKYSGFISPEEREALMSKEGISTVPKKKTTEGMLIQLNTFEDEEVADRPKFEIDMRKAVVYSEILNRKYI
ncbi:MAG TPA: hypothetical protein PKH79_09360 [Prolixibacteraceae bacterium]|nr:hypothetical protein [Prolixibacteraceae bacterium]HPS14097.1 hypothetical protein [Prolixibacteraceae bacterium]